MTLLGIIEITDESTEVNVYGVSTYELLTFYDGKNSIDETYNRCRVLALTTTDDGILKIMIDA